MDERSHSAPHVVIDLDDVLQVTGWNRRAEMVFGLGQAEVLGRPIAELLPIAGEPDAWSAVLLADSDAPRVRPIARPDGQRMFDTWSQVTRDGDGRPVGATIYGHEVTARQSSERRLALESSLLKALINNLDVTVWAVDRQGTFIYHDGKALGTTGLTPGQLLGQNLFELYGETEGTADVRNALAGEARLAIPSELYGIQWLNWFIPVADDTDTAVVAVSLDISETRRNEVELRDKLDLIEKQQDAIRELSTPILEVWDGIITLPIVGLVDSVRTAEIMDNLLEAVTRVRARYAILDLTGVEVVDTGTASHLINMIQAIRLLGAEGILTGIHPVIAQTIVSLGVDLSQVIVHGKLRDALQYCITRLGSGKRQA